MESGGEQERRPTPARSMVFHHVGTFVERSLEVGDVDRPVESERDQEHDAEDRGREDQPGDHRAIDESVRWCRPEDHALHAAMLDAVIRAVAQASVANDVSSIVTSAPRYRPRTPASSAQ